MEYSQKSVVGTSGTTIVHMQVQSHIEDAAMVLRRCLRVLLELTLDLLVIRKNVGKVLLPALGCIPSTIHHLQTLPYNFLARLIENLLLVPGKWNYEISSSSGACEKADIASKKTCE